MADGSSLSEKESELLDEWHREIIEGVSGLTVYEEYSKMLISELPWEDMQSLRLNSSSLNSNKDMLVVDLVMELNLFLDSSVIEDYEKRVKAQEIEKKYGVPVFMFEDSQSNCFTHQNNLAEEAIVAKKSVISD